MGHLQLNDNQFLTFFAVAIRLGVILSVMPVIGENNVPKPLKVLLSLVIAYAVFPLLIASKVIHVKDASVWGATTGGIVGTIALEAMLALALGFTAKVIFDVIQIGAEVLGQFMGFAMATQYDPRQESQTLLLAQFQNAIAMLIFLAMDGHHIMLKAATSSYAVVPIGGANFGADFAKHIVSITNQVLRLGLQLAAPMAIALFMVNIVYGVMAKALPQLNVLVLSFSVSSFVGLVMMFWSFPEFQHVTSNLFDDLGYRLQETLVTLGK